MKKGFTLLELLIVIIIIGVLAGLAIPNLFRAVEKSRSAEGRSLLGVLRSAQMRYYAENSVFTNSVANLDTDFTPPKFFTVTLLAPAYSNNAVIVRTTRTNTENPGYGNYNLNIEVDGDMTCSGGTAGSCARLGF